MSTAIDWNEFGAWDEKEAQRIEESIIKKVIDWRKFSAQTEEGAQVSENELHTKKVIWNERTMCSRCAERNKRYAHANQRLELVRLTIVGLKAQIRELDTMLTYAEEYSRYPDAKIHATFLYEHFNELQMRLRSAERTLRDAVDYETRCDYELQRPCGRYSDCC